MKHISELLSRCGHKLAVVLMSLFMVATFAVANPNQAHAGLEVDLAGGWDDMLLDSSVWENSNHGFVGTLSVGFRFFDLVGIFYEQDLGYIHPKTKSKLTNEALELLGQDKKYFKGASLASVRLFISFLAILEFSARLGFGSMYMKSESDWQKWFAFRPGVGLAVKLGSLRVGGEFDYTLGSADKNNWDNDKTSHFISAKIFAGWVF